MTECIHTQQPQPLDVAVILARMTESNFYMDALLHKYGMCTAVTWAHYAGFLNHDERRACCRAIDEYLSKFERYSGRHSPFLRDALRLAGLPPHRHDLISIYRDWNNRPQPWSNTK